MSDRDSWPEPGDPPPPNYPPPGSAPPPNYPPPNYPPPGSPPPPGYPPPGWPPPPPGGPGWAPPPGGPGYGYPSPAGWGAPRGGPWSPTGRPLAEWWRRMLAIILDSLILGAAGLILGAIFFGSRMTTSSNGSLTLGRGYFVDRYLLDLGIGLLYYGYFNGVVGQTIGKMALRIRVVDESSGRPIGVGRGMLRYFIYAVLFFACLIPGIVSVLSPLWDPMRQAWHDKVAHSLVVSDE